ncbi:MAG: hypothetical protein CSB01_01400 [Bacteroidia bacterium]|nr:MAG: hypothetical protein CSB01_01400 [Bacteroidia bacterium]
MRTIKDIKRSMAEDFINNEVIKEAYGLQEGKSFEEQFSQASLESILFYTFATAVWLLENLFYEHRAEVEQRLADLLPHTLRWYELKAKAFRYGQKLLPNSDKYSDKGLTADEIKKAQRVRYAVASESKNVVYLKVAGQNDKGKPRLLTADEYAGFVHYINEIKDAGVLFDIINKPADKIKLDIDVYVPSSLIDSTTELRQVLTKEVERVLYELPFDGRYRSSDLLTAIEKVDKVEVAYIRQSQTQAEGASEWTSITAYHRPVAGYYALESLNINFQEYNQYEK